MKQVIYGIITVLLLTSCRSTFISDSWKKPGVEPIGTNRVLVFAIIRDEDQMLREQMEAHMAGDLVDLGYNAVSAFKVFGPGAFKNLSREQAIEKIKQNGVDAVITIVLLKKSVEKRYYPGHGQFDASDFYHQGFSTYYQRMSELVQQKGYYIENTHYSWESNLYKLDKQELLYTVRTDSFDPATSEQQAHEYGRVIVKNFVRNGVFSKKPGKHLKAF